MTKPKDKKFMRLSRLTKNRLRDFNLEEARGWTIDRLQQIEHRIDEIIINHFQPKNKHSFKKILLNSSIMDIGSKLKVLRNIDSVSKETIEKVRKLAFIRNGFAHAPIIEHVLINISETKTSSRPSKAKVKTMIEVMNSQGEIKSKNAYEYLVEFWTIDNELRETL